MANPAKPTVVKIREGNLGRRPLNLNEPRFAGIAAGAEPAVALAEISAKLWRGYLEAAEGTEHLRETDLPALAILCQEQAAALLLGGWLEQAAERIRAGKTPNKSALAALRLIATVQAEQSNMARRDRLTFGFDPSSRTRFDGGATEKLSPVEDALFA